MEEQGRNQDETPTALLPTVEAVPAAFRYGVVTKFEEMKAIFQAHQQLLRELMTPGVDFGAIPGTTGDKALFKAGAEKLQLLHGYSHEMVLMDEHLDWEAPFFFYRYRCDVYDRRTGALVGQGYGSCNSAESKYAYRWVTKAKVPVELDLRLLPSRTRKNRTTYRILNPDVPDLVNTIDKMAQKRAFVGAIRVCTGASGLFLEEGFDERNSVAEAQLPPTEEVPKEKAKEEKTKPEPKVETKAKILYNKANAALQEEGLPAYYRTSEHVLNTLKSEGGLTVKQILSTSEESLLNLLIKHAKEGTREVE